MLSHLSSSWVFSIYNALFCLFLYQIIVRTDSARQKDIDFWYWISFLEELHNPFHCFTWQLSCCFLSNSKVQALVRVCRLFVLNAHYFAYLDLWKEKQTYKTKARQKVEYNDSAIKSWVTKCVVVRWEYESSKHWESWGRWCVSCR